MVSAIRSILQELSEPFLDPVAWLELRPRGKVDTTRPQTAGAGNGLMECMRQGQHGAEGQCEPVSFTCRSRNDRTIPTVLSASLVPTQALKAAWSSSPADVMKLP